MMRRQIRHMAQSKLCLLSMDRAPEELDFMQYGTLKMIYMEQVCMAKCAAGVCEPLTRRRALVGARVSWHVYGCVCWRRERAREFVR